MKLEKMDYRGESGAMASQGQYDALAARVTALEADSKVQAGEIAVLQSDSKTQAGEIAVLQAGNFSGRVTQFGGRHVPCVVGLETDEMLVNNVVAFPIGICQAQFGEPPSALLKAGTVVHFMASLLTPVNSKLIFSVYGYDQTDAGGVTLTLDNITNSTTTIVEAWVHLISGTYPIFTTRLTIQAVVQGASGVFVAPSGPTCKSNSGTFTLDLAGLPYMSLQARRILPSDPVATRTFAMAQMLS